MDPFTAFLTRDWAALGGWSLFVALCLLIVVGSFREWWSPGARTRRLETALEKSSAALAEALAQNGQLITANEITKHFFEETAPKRSTP